MKTFEITRDVVYDGNSAWIILSESDIEKMRANAKTEPNKDMAAYLKNTADSLARDRKTHKDKIRVVSLTVKRPTPADRIEIRSTCREKDGSYNQEREPLAICLELLRGWNLADEEGKPLEFSADNIRENMPLCLMDLVYGEVMPQLYPSMARLAFLPQPGV